MWQCNKPQHGKMYLPKCAPNRNSNQPDHPCSLIRVFVVCTKKLCILGYPKCAQWKFWSDCVKMQANLNLCWAHMSKGTDDFLILWFKWLEKWNILLTIRRYVSVYLPFILNIFVNTHGDSNGSQSIIPTWYKHQAHTEGKSKQGEGPVTSGKSQWF